MLTKKLIADKLKCKYQEKESFTRKELFDFYRSYEPDLNESTFRWRIHDLKEKRVLRSVSRSEFSLSYKPVFKPEIEKICEEIFNLVDAQFPLAKKSVWHTRWLLEFMQHLPGKHQVLVEVEKDAVESAFYLLKDRKFQDIFIQPGEKEIDRYIAGTREAIIVQSLVTKAPLQTVKKTSIPAIEKILVDLYTDHYLFNAFQGAELHHIFNNVYERYAVNFTKLFAYARRRGKEEDLTMFISNKTNIPGTLIQ